MNALSGAEVLAHQNEDRHRVEGGVGPDAGAQAAAARGQDPEHDAESDEGRELEGLEVDQAEDDGRSAHGPGVGPGAGAETALDRPQDETPEEQLFGDRRPDDE